MTSSDHLWFVCVEWGPQTKLSENGECFFSKGKRQPQLLWLFFRPRWVESWYESWAENIHYGQCIERRATYLLRTFIYIRSLKFSFGLSAQSRAIEFSWQKVGAFILAEDFLGEISKPLTSRDLAFVTVRFSFMLREKSTSKYKTEGNFSYTRKLLITCVILAW